MKKFIYLLCILFFLGCSKNNPENELQDTYRGKLVVKGICMNYVIQVLDSDFDSYLLELNWTNEFSDISYNNVFALGSVCDFPEDINEGDEFNFIIDNTKENNCAVCLAFSPTPNKYLSITVID
jgi:hypothetical protein|tara:strand:- start:762 stop:1133 length:372 start_codon:yes stop_codon:yes gene_type:complete